MKFFWPWLPFNVWPVILVLFEGQLLEIIEAISACNLGWIWVSGCWIITVLLFDVFEWINIGKTCDIP